MIWIWVMCNISSASFLGAKLLCEGDFLLTGIKIWHKKSLTKLWFKKFNFHGPKFLLACFFSLFLTMVTTLSFSNIQRKKGYLSLLELQPFSLEIKKKQLKTNGESFWILFFCSFKHSLNEIYIYQNGILLCLICMEKNVQMQIRAFSLPEMILFMDSLSNSKFRYPWNLPHKSKRIGVHDQEKKKNQAILSQIEKSMINQNM